MGADGKNGGENSPAPSPFSDPPSSQSARVRHGEGRDAAQLAGLIAALHRGEGNPCLASAEGLQRDLIGKAIVIVAEGPDRRLVGYATGHPTYDTAHAETGIHVGDLYVALDHRRRGIARAMLAAMARAGHAQGARHLWLTAREDNAPAHAFYRRLGARGEGVMAFAVVYQDFLNLAAEKPR